MVFACLGIILSAIFLILHIKIRNQIEYYTSYSLGSYPFFFKYQPKNVTVNLVLDPKTMSTAFNLAISLDFAILI